MAAEPVGEAPVKILYLSCHSILEYDEVKLFTEMGLDVFSHGAYMNPENQGDGLRPRIDGLKDDKKLLEIACRTNKDHLTEEMLEPFDTVIVMSLPHWISNNWKIMKGKRVIWRTIGQNNHHNERMMKPYREEGLQIARYSPRESTIPGYIGGDAVIRFYKDPNIYCGWTGEKARVINFTQSMKSRARECNYAFYRRVMKGLPHTLFGPQNENIGEPWAVGAISYARMIEELQENRAYFYSPTYPTSYTLNFIEAWMTGIPVVSLGRERGNDPELLRHSLYEVPDLVRHGNDGFYADDAEEFREILQDLLNDRAYAESIGKKGRERAVEIFGRETVKNQWQQFLERDANVFISHAAGAETARL